MPESLYDPDKYAKHVKVALVRIADFYNRSNEYFDTDMDDGSAGIDLNKIDGYADLEEAILKLHKCTKKGGKKSRNSRKSRKSRK